jgi:transposase
MFPGKSSSKASQLLAPAKAFNRLNYDTLLVDFRGVGGSSGSTNTLGIRKAKDVALALSYAQSSKLKRPFILYGISMGSAAVLRAIAIKKVNPAVEAAGAKVIFLPKYSPDLSPIELLWSKIKEFLRSRKPRTREELDHAIADALNTVTKKDIVGWFSACDAKMLLL